LILGQIIGARPLFAEDASCAAASRYVMPKDVETSGATPGAAPADLAGSRSGYKLPRKLGFDLEVNPLGAPFGQSTIPLGHVEIDRKTDQTRLNGKLLDGPADAEVGCLDAKPH
jgi:hypothetical protein